MGISVSHGFHCGNGAASDAYTAPAVPNSRAPCLFSAQSSALITSGFVCVAQAMSSRLFRPGSQTLSSSSCFRPCVAP
eukprot:2259488-Lingulodinium_polyedra.AAC.1